MLNTNTYLLNVSQDGRQIYLYVNSGFFCPYIQFVHIGGFLKYCPRVRLPLQAYGLIASYVRDKRNNSKWPTNRFTLSSRPILRFRVFCLHKAVWGVRFALGLIRHRLSALLQPVIDGVHETQKLAISDFTPKLSLFPI